MNKKFFVLLLVCSMILSGVTIPVSSDNVLMPVFRMVPGANSSVVVDSTGGITGIMSIFAIMIFMLIKLRTSLEFPFPI